MIKLKSVIVVFFIIILNFASNSQTSNKELYNDIQKNSKEEKTIRFVMWLPDEFWKVTFSKNTSLTSAQLDTFLLKVHSYSIFFVVDGKISPFGTVNYSEKDSILKNSTLILQNGEKYFPIDNSKINSDLKNLLDMMRPVFANMFGAMGQNMNYIIFKKGNSNDPLMLATDKTTFIYHYQNEEFKWHLPLPSLLPKKTCNGCNEIFPGNYNYCPYDGKKLK